MEFADHTIETAPAGARAALEGAKRKFGGVPKPLARLAASPTAVAAFHDLLAHFDGASLDEREREVVAFVVATTNACHYCVALHSRLAGKTLDGSAIAALRRGEPLADPRLEALRGFTLAVLESRGDVADADRVAFAAAGFSTRHALDVVVGIATYTLSTFANRLTRAPLDHALEPYRWPDAGT
jgi:uncharacterized peroxidase-related enzyme